ncbi:hypothetical protein GBF38_017631 [Nibea albiflora]|uniref:Uncharacterized protein n=1 Tax=Nibea albiflora TaxID=240163 RepID=A0ACB7F4Q7_NIBAL|nr:hypothetical protein GBF38_017631 [Nibea albiflora]
MVRVELEWEIPMSVTLPIQVQTDPAHQPFPFLDTTLADLGIEESEVKERVVWVDTKKTQVKNKAGKLKEKEITILEVRVKAQKPGDKQLQEVLYSTEAHTDRSFCRTGMDILPWKHRSAGLESFNVTCVAGSQLSVLDHLQLVAHSSYQNVEFMCTLVIRPAATSQVSGGLSE